MTSPAPAPIVAGLVRAYTATVIAVVDGDTVKLDADLGRISPTGGPVRDYGFHTYRAAGHLRIHESFRLYGLNCPEHATPAGDAATAFTAALLPPGTQVIARVRQVGGHDAQEKYGRWLATIVVAGVGTDVNAALIAAGHALPWDGKGARPVPLA